MTTQDIGLFRAIGAKMNYDNQRQRLISQNIANSDTPGYRPLDLSPVDFGSFMKGALGEEAGMMKLGMTNSVHMTPVGGAQPPAEKVQKKTYEVSPSGNAVDMEEQLIVSNQTIADYNLMANLYQKNMGLIKMALGRN